MTKNRPAGSPRGGPRRSIGRDGVVRVELRRGGLPTGLLALGLAGAGLLAALLWKGHRGDFLSSTSSPGSAASAHAHSKGAHAAAAPAPARAKDAPTLRLTVRAPDTAAPSNAHVVVAEEHEDTVLPGQDEPSSEAREKAAIDRVAGAAREKTGIAAFPAPGTKRIKPGLKVPEDFPLPPGYMRHYQATDNGQMLEPILVYHPDYELVDAEGHVIPLPPDRVVPPDDAPEGLPVETLEIPADAYADRDEPGPGTNADPGQTGVEEEKPPNKEP